MKKTILLAAALFSMAAQAQTPGSVAMGAGYGNQVFYKFSSQLATSVAHNSWDLAFYRASSMSTAIRANEAKGIQTFEVGDNSAWTTVNVSQEANWTPLYNSETVWDNGSFDNGSAQYGWGTYNPVTHHVTGARVFVLKYADGSYKKVKIDDYFGGYTFTFSSWDGNAWSADTTQTIANATGANRFFNYFSLNTNSMVAVEPENTQWDILFTKYNTDIMGDGSMMYPVTGVLHHPNVQVAVNEEADGMPSSPELSFWADINKIGYDWKSFNGTGYTVNSDRAFYIKLADNTIWRLVFNTFEGSSTGVITFNQQDVTSLLGTQELPNRVSFGVYPNPSANGKISVIYDGIAAGSKSSVSVYSLTGAKVFEKNLENSGFSNSELNLSSLEAGVYVLKFEAGEYSAARKIVLE